MAIVNNPLYDYEADYDPAVDDDPGPTPTDWITFGAVMRACFALHDAAEADGADLDHLTDDADIAQLVKGVMILRQAREATRSLEEWLTGALVNLGADGQVVPGVGALELRPSVSRVEWDHEALIDDVIACICVTPDITPAQALRRFVSIARPSWRIGDSHGKPGIKAFGLDPDEYSKVSRRPPVLRVVS